MNWTDQIPGSFGAADLIFASHQLDKERAKKMLIAAIEAEVTMDEITSAVLEYLNRMGCGRAHIEEQIERIKNLSTIK